MDESPVLHNENYVTVIVGALWESLPQVILGGLFFALLASPAFVLFSLGWIWLTLAVSVVTIAPTWAALLAYELPLVHDKVTSASRFWQALRRYWWRSSALGCLAAFPIASALFKLPLLRQTEVPPTLWLSFAADFFMAGLVASLLLYAFPLLIRNDLGLVQSVRDGWLLMGRHLRNTLGLLGLAILCAFAVGSISLGLLFLLPAVYGLFIIGNCELVIQ